MKRFCCLSFKGRMFRPLAMFAVLAGLMMSVSPAFAGSTTYVVTNTLDTNGCTVSNCSLRGAIKAANLNAGTDTIVFNIPGAGPHVIALATALPTITNTVIIDASTAEATTQCSPPMPTLQQPPPPHLDIVLNGTEVTGNGLTFTSSNNKVKGLVIKYFAGGAAIDLAGGGSNVVACNYIGTDVTGTQWAGNFSGISIHSPFNTIGGTAAGDGNLISGNGTGILVDAGGHDNYINGNKIGTNASGLAAIPNTVGVDIQGGATWNWIGGLHDSLNPGVGNLISGNAGDGIRITGGAPFENYVFDNYIGIGADHVTPVGNGGAGVSVLTGGHLNAKRNVFAYNSWSISTDTGPDSFVSMYGGADGRFANCFVHNTGGFITYVPTQAGYNWWGAPTGPNTPGADTLYPATLTTPWLTFKPLYCP